MSGLLHDVFVQTMVLRWLATVCAGLVLVLLIMLVARLGMQETQKVWLTLRGKIPAVIGAVDEPTDVVNTQIDRLLDRLKPDDWGKLLAVFLPVFVQSLADGLDKALKVETTTAGGDGGDTVDFVERVGTPEPEVKPVGPVEAGHG